MKKALVFFLTFLVLIPVVWLLAHQFEGAAPEVEIGMPSVYLKKDYQMTVSVSDERSGLRQVVVSVMQRGKETVLLEKNYESPGLLGFFNGAVNPSDTLLIPVDVRKAGMADGEAVIRVKATDYSWRRLNKGNLFYTEKKAVIDTVPPKIKVLSRRHNLERGGSALLIYQVFEKGLKSGVRVGDNFFPGRAGLFKNEQIHAAFFALDHTQGPGTPLQAVAVDAAGNETITGFHNYIRDKRFKTDVLNIPDGFLNSKMPGFDTQGRDEQYAPAQNPLLGKYIFVNNQIRKENVKQLLAVPARSVGELFWQDRFLRLRGSQRRAGFADHRIYKYKGKQIDTATHLGIDLASTRNAEVGAANSGRVLFTGTVGIFGKTVIIDHGFGLCSLYSHLTDILVQETAQVAKGEIIGHTGVTGLAAGDHLHFSMMVHNVFVNPVEWWDRSWIKNNITAKIEAVRQAQGG